MLVHGATWKADQLEKPCHPCSLNSETKGIPSQFELHDGTTSKTLGKKVNSKA